MLTRKYNTTRNGMNFSEYAKAVIWNKGSIIPGYSSAIFRKDCCGAIMRYSDYGNVNSAYGWEIDHQVAVANGGSDDMRNLQPLQWQNNREKSNNTYWSCAVVAR